MICQYYKCRNELGKKKGDKRTRYCSSLCWSLDRRLDNTDIRVKVGKYDFIVTNKGIVDFNIIGFFDEKRRC